MRILLPLRSYEQVCKSQKVWIHHTSLRGPCRSCNTSFSMEGYAAEVGGVLQKKLMPLDETLREEMLETRIAVNDQAANIEKVSQVRFGHVYGPL